MAPANPAINGLRLTLTTGLAVPAADVSSAATAYLVPYDSNTIALHDGVAWVARASSVPATITTTGANPSTAYTVYAYWNGENVVLEKEAAPAVPAFGVRDGVQVKASDVRRRYVGVLATNAAGFFEDSAKNRLVWNRDNQVRRSVNGANLSSWTMSVNLTWREAGASAASRVTIASGSLGGAGSGTYLAAEVVGMCVPASSSANSAYFMSGIGIDSTVSNVAQKVELAAGTYPSTYAHGYASYEGYLSPGLHTLHWLETAMQGSFACIGYAYDPPFGRLGLNGWVLM